MVTSALEREGKSTTAANLAVAFARAGDCVILVDLDLRQPFLHRLFHHESQPGITDVVLGQVALADAVFEVAIEANARPLRPWRRGGASAGGASLDDRTQTLGVLPAGSCRLTRASSSALSARERLWSRSASRPTSSLSTRLRSSTSATRSR